MRDLKTITEQCQIIPPQIKAQINIFHPIKSTKPVKKEESKKSDSRIEAILKSYEKKIKEGKSKKNLLYVSCESGNIEAVQYILRPNNIDINEKSTYNILFVFLMILKIKYFNKIKIIYFNKIKNKYFNTI